MKAKEGIKRDQGKPRLELLPMQALIGLAQVLTFGAEKYSDEISLHEALCKILSEIPTVIRPAHTMQKASAEIVMKELCAQEILHLLNDKDKIAKHGQTLIKIVKSNSIKNIETFIKSVSSLLSKPINSHGLISTSIRRKNYSHSKKTGAQSAAATRLINEVLTSITVTRLRRCVGSCAGNVIWGSECLTIIKSFYERHSHSFSIHRLKLYGDKFIIVGTGDRNWERGIKWSRVFGATLRHLFAYWLGQDHDPETGLPHIDHALCNVGFLAEYFQTRKEFDDRPKLSRNKHLTQTQRVHKS